MRDRRRFVVLLEEAVQQFVFAGGSAGGPAGSDESSMLTDERAFRRV
jgi:hypothetical protein